MGYPAMMAAGDIFAHRRQVSPQLRPDVPSDGRILSGEMPILFIRPPPDARLCSITIEAIILKGSR